MQRVFILASLIVISQFVFSQEYQPVEQYTIADGLPHSSVTCLHTDSRDLLWIGTQDGLSRFNGISFYNYQASIYDTISLPNDNIIDITEDKNGNLWCLTPVALSKYVPAFDGFVSYFFYPVNKNNKTPVLLKDFSLDITGDKIFVLGDDYLGELDIRTGTINQVSAALTDSSLQQYDFTSVDYLAYNQKLLMKGSSVIAEYSVATNSIVIRMIPEQIQNRELKIITGSVENYWLFTNEEVWISNADTAFTRMEINSNNQDLEYPILDIAYLENHSLNIITTSQFLSYDIVQKNLLEELQYSLDINNTSTISSVIQMDCGVFWIGTDVGLFKFNMHQHIFRHYSLDTFFKSNTEVSSLVFDTNNYLWLGTTGGEILILDPGDKNSSGNREVNRMRMSSEIFTLVRDFDERIWAGTRTGLFEISDNKSIVYPDSEDSHVSLIYPVTHDTLICVGINEVFMLIPSHQHKITISEFSAFLDQEVIGIFNKESIIYLVQTERIFQYDLRHQQHEIIPTIYPESNIFPVNNTVHISGSGKILIGTSDGIFESSGKRFSLKPLLLHHAINNQYIRAITQDNNNMLWLSTNNGLFSSDSTRALIRKYSYSDGLNHVQFSNRLAASSSNGQVCFAGKKNFVLFNAASIPEYLCDHSIEIMDVKLIGRNDDYLKSLTGIDSITVDPIYRHMMFSFAALDYWNPSENRLAYSLVKVGKPDDWIALNGENTVLISGLRAGLYSLKVDGTNHSGQWNSETRELIIKVNAPIWQSRIAIISYGVFLIVLIYILIYFRTKHLWKLNREYKEREIIAKQIEVQKEELTVKNKNITDSINYAKRIQMALMPSKKLFAKTFPDSFILHMPKDIVSGDFYWINQVAGRTYFAAVDCTGHGVPGAFMSIIGFELFRRITEIEKKKQPAEILNSLSKGFETIFQDVESITLRDGMDVAFCAIDKDMKVLEFAGAFNPLYLVRDNTITEIKGDRCSVGLDQELGLNGENIFSDHVIQLHEGDIIYIFTDGFADQFGGPEGKKYKYRRFRHLLLALHQLPMERQVEFLQRSILDWKGDLDQVDDILVMGIRINRK